MWMLLILVAHSTIVTADESSAEHPLALAIAEATDCLQYVRENIKDYSCLAIRRERINGRLHGFEYFTAKVRRQQTADGVESPFALYLKFLSPESVKDREVLYVQGQNRDKMFVHNGGKRLAHIRTRLDPTSQMAMRDNRYPVTEFGVENLLKRLIEVAEEDMASESEVEVEFYRNATVNERICHGLQVRHPKQEDSERFHLAKVYLDAELKVPVHFESYSWPDASGEPQLLEQYTYTNIKVNIGLTDEDFDPANPNYDLIRRDAEEPQITKN